MPRRKFPPASSFAPVARFLPLQCSRKGNQSQPICKNIVQHLPRPTKVQSLISADTCGIGVGSWLENSTTDKDTHYCGKQIHSAQNYNQWALGSVSVSAAGLLGEFGQVFLHLQNRDNDTALPRKLLEICG